MMKNLIKYYQCLLSLIYNENFENLSKTFRETYNFNPKLFPVDFGKAGIKAILNAFPHWRILLVLFSPYENISY